MRLAAASAALVVGWGLMLADEVSGQEAAACPAGTREETFVYGRDLSGQVGRVCGVELSLPAESLVATCTDGEGAVQGPVRAWYQTGEQALTGSCETGKATGAWTSWYREGGIMHEVHYRDGRLEGRESLWSYQGALLYTATLRGGELDGRSTAWFANGALAEMRSYAEGRPEGIWRSWHPNGKLAGERTFREGREQGWSSTWDGSGHRVSRSGRGGSRRRVSCLLPRRRRGCCWISCRGSRSRSWPRLRSWTLSRLLRGAG